MEEELPLMTIILSVILVASYLFTAGNLKNYEYLLGFIPARPTIYSLVTYTLIHVDIFHLASNLVILIIAGMAIEKHIGKFTFFEIFIASGCIAAIFDTLSRLLLGISMSYPFVGASGAIFGLIAVAALSKPMEKIPTFLVALTLLPFAQLIVGIPELADQKVFLSVLIFSAALLIIILYTLPHYLPVFVATLIFIFSWIMFLIFSPPMSISNIGHLGGLVGGIIFMFAFPREERT
jgi:membrane associated rhomboid family serine protease